MSGSLSQLRLEAARAAQGTVRLPGSKSISNRVLLLAALAEGTTQVDGLLDADDTRVMLDALDTLGVRIQESGVGRRTGIRIVEGIGGAFPVKHADLFMGNAGTAIRPLTAALAFSGGEYRLSGVPRMHERPIRDLVDALRSLGARIDYLGNEGYPPLAIHPPSSSVQARRAEIVDPRITRVRGDVSSQFLTALLMAGPLAGPAEPSESGTRPVGSSITIEVAGELISKPYIEITLNVMRRFGIEVARDGWQSFSVPAGRYRSPGRIRVEGDASSASYFLAAGLLGGGPVRVEGVGRDSIQGDVRFVELLERLGATVTLGDDYIETSASRRPSAFDLDLNHIPDAAMTAAVIALFADGPSTVRNVASWRVKETDRLAAMATELRKVGAEVEEGPDFLRITPGPLRGDVAIGTYDDHRMAMSFALVALGGVPVRIDDPGCVAKTFPTFFDEFRRILR